MNPPGRPSPDRHRKGVHSFTQSAGGVLTQAVNWHWIFFVNVPTSVTIGVVSLGLSARLGARFGPRAVLLPGLLLFAGTFLLLARVPDGHVSYAADILPPILLMGVAFGLAVPSLMTLGMSDAGPADAGLVSGVFNTAQQIGGALGLAVPASLAGARTDRELAPGAPSPPP